MVFDMKLMESPFERIRNGSKVVEIRINDEKRQKVKIGDKIVFSKLPDLKEKLEVEVIDLYRAENFKDLFEKLGVKEAEIKNKIEAMYSIYSKEEEKEYGVIGIKIKLDTEVLKKQIEAYIPWNEQEEKDKSVILKYMDTFEDVLTRQNEFGHFTASSWVVNKQRTKVLMIYHNIYKSWAWTGGHSDGENDLLKVAIKEVKEETGVENVKPIIEDIFSMEIICVNGHIKKGKYVSSHVHLNLTYLLEVDENENLRIKEDENSGVKWVDIDQAVAISNERWAKEIYQKIIDKMESK